MTGFVVAVAVVLVLVGVVLGSLRLHRRRLERIMGSLLEVGEERTARHEAERALALAELELRSLRARARRAGSEERYDDRSGKQA